MFCVRSIAFRRFSPLLNPLQLNRSSFIQIRNHSADVRYRLGGSKPSRMVAASAQLIGGFMWWWVLTHLYYEWEHVLGEFDYPDPRVWADEELGVTEYSEGDGSMEEIEYEMEEKPLDKKCITIKGKHFVVVTEK